MVKYGWNEEKLRKVEPFFHAFLWPFASTLSVYSTIHNLFGLIVESKIPKDCEEIQNDCTPSPGSLNVARYTMLFINTIHLTFSLFVMFQICGVAMESQEERTSRLVAIKGTLYALVVTIVEVPVAIWLAFYYLTGYGNVYSCLAIDWLLEFSSLHVESKKNDTAYGVAWRKALDWIANSCCSCFNAHDDVDLQPKAEGSEIR